MGYLLGKGQRHCKGSACITIEPKGRSDQLSVGLRDPVMLRNKIMDPER
jgi:hypothetical protein